MMQTSESVFVSVGKHHCCLITNERLKDDEELRDLWNEQTDRVGFIIPAGSVQSGLMSVRL